jgi:hypothetical protein
MRFYLEIDLQYNIATRLATNSITDNPKILFLSLPH